MLGGSVKFFAGRCRHGLGRSSVHARPEWPPFPFFSELQNPPEFARPRLSRVKERSSPARGYIFGCLFLYMAGHYPGILMTGHIGKTTPKFARPC